jgi:tetratricopeptide (TPR) repeat protein
VDDRFRNSDIATPHVGRKSPEFSDFPVAHALLGRSRLPQGKLLARGAGEWHSEDRFPAMTRIFFALAVTLAAAAPALADARDDAKKQVEFGISVAQRGLWREAIYRWQRATQIDPTYAAAYNNLAVAYEHEGDFDKARQSYEKAVELEPNNAMIKQNYELFREINDRTTRKDSQ